jgi:hypothetical protein
MHFQIRFVKKKVKVHSVLMIVTDQALSERRPDLICQVFGTKCKWIVEIACAWEPLIPEREAEKRRKYQALARDLALQEPGWVVEVVPLVVGDLGSLVSFRRNLKETDLLNDREIDFLARNCQFESLCAGVRVVRQTLSRREAV